MMLALSQVLHAIQRGTRCCLLHRHKSAQLCIVIEYLVMLLAMREKLQANRVDPLKFRVKSSRGC